MTRIDDIRALVEAEERWRLPMPGVPQAHGEVGIRTWIEASFYLLDLIDQAKEFAEASAPKGPPYTVPDHTMLAPGMRTPIQQRAEQWLLEVRGESNVPAGKDGDR